MQRVLEVGHATLECRRDEAPDCALTEDKEVDHA